MRACVGLLAFVGVGVAGCTGDRSEPASSESESARRAETGALTSAARAPATVEMAERLQGIAETIQPREHPYIVSARLDSARTREVPTELRERLRFRASLAQEALHVGRHDEAIETFESLLGEIQEHREAVPGQLTLGVLQALEVAYLKTWEQRECVEARRSPHCVVPIRRMAAGVDESIPRSAMRLLTTLLQFWPENRMYQWHLNLAYMMTGGYPEAVPERWRIPVEAFEPEYDLGRYPELAAELGLDVAGHAGGSIIDDFDGDGFLDIVASSWHLSDQLRFFRNNGDGSFTDRTVEAGLEGIVGGLNLVQADYDNDGHVDIFVLRGAWTDYGEPNSLLRNRGDGTFEDVTEAAGLLSVYPTQTAAWGDYDNDGWLDLYIGNESVGGPRNPSQLFHNNGDGTFRDVAEEVGAAIVGFVKGVVWGDIDNDGRLDLYISRLNEPNLLLRNEGPGPDGRWRFADVTRSAGVSEPVRSFPVWFWDYDNDGWLDLFVSGYSAEPADVAAEYLDVGHGAEPPRLYRNNGDGTFTDVAGRTRLDRVLLSMGSSYGDLDNDGYEDFYVGTGDANVHTIMPNRMFRNAGGRTFQEVTSSGGFGHLGKGHGVSFGDLDNDGDQDMHVTMGGAYEGDVARNLLFENPGHGNGWVTLRLEGVGSNRSAIGARIKVTVETETGPQEIHRMVTSGGSFGANSLQVEVGLGSASRIRALEVGWPTTGTRSRYADVELNRIYEIREGDDVLQPVPTRRFRLARDPGR